MSNKRENHFRLFMIAIILGLLMAHTASAEISKSIIEEQSALIRIDPDTQDQLLADYAEQQKWCDRPLPKAQAGEIIIYWTRDKRGRCLEENFLVGR